MQNLTDLLQNKDQESYRKAADLVEKLKDETFEPLANAYYNTTDSEIKTRVIKLMGSINNPRAVSFITNSLEDEDFSVRRTAALTLKLLTDEDYYSEIYWSDVGRTLKRDFWCYLDFVDEKTKKKNSRETIKSSKTFTEFFKKLSQFWSYPDPKNPKYFSFRRKKHAEMSEDGRTLFKNFNFSLLQILNSSKYLLDLIDKLVELSTAKQGQDEELNDIMNCLRQSFGNQLKNLEEGFSTFLAAFHYIRLEFNLALEHRYYEHLEQIPLEFTMEEVKMKNKLVVGFTRRGSFEQLESIDPEFIAHELILLRKGILQFHKHNDEFCKNPHISFETYLDFKQMGLAAHFTSIPVLNLLSNWCKND